MFECGLKFRPVRRSFFVSRPLESEYYVFNAIVAVNTVALLYHPIRYRYNTTGGFFIKDIFSPNHKPLTSEVV